jgi:gp32 DNA binding protein like
MSSFANLKRSSGSSLDKLAKAVESMNSNTYNDGEDNYWKCEVDKSGNGYAIIRFLPSPPADGDDSLPWAKYYDHGFNGPGGWYIEKSLTTVGKPDPCSEYNTTLWNSGIEANKEVARKQKRRLHYVSNVYIVKDPKHPENEGKVFLFRYGKKIMEKITTAMNPQFEDDAAFDPFGLVLTSS